MMLFDIAPVINETKSNEWYTPSRYIEAARKVMGGIDLDPASCKLANETVKAEKYYTKEENGLAQEWYGRVWLNPPFGRDLTQAADKRSIIDRWVTKLVNGYQIGNVKQAILLATTRTDTPWFRLAWDFPICFADHGVRFYLPYGSLSPSAPGRNTNNHIHGTCFVYLGPHEQSFIDIFSEFGTIAKRVSSPKRIIQPPSLWDDVESEE